MYESSSSLSCSEESIVRWEMMTRQIIPAVPMATYGEVVRMVKGRPSEIDTEAATFQKVDLPSGGTVILANYPLGTSNETSDEEYSATTQKYKRLSSLSHRYSKGSSEEVVKGLNSPVQNIQDDREARHTKHPINLYDKQPAVLEPVYKTSAGRSSRAPSTSYSTGPYRVRPHSTDDRHSMYDDQYDSGYSTHDKTLRGYGLPPPAGMYRDNPPRSPSSYRGHSHYGTEGHLPVPHYERGSERGGGSRGGSRS